MSVSMSRSSTTECRWPCEAEPARYRQANQAEQLKFNAPAPDSSAAFMSGFSSGCRLGSANRAFQPFGRNFVSIAWWDCAGLGHDSLEVRRIAPCGPLFEIAHGLQFGQPPGDGDHDELVDRRRKAESISCDGRHCILSKKSPGRHVSTPCRRTDGSAGR